MLNIVCFAALPLGSSVDFLATRDPLIEEKDDVKLAIYDKHDNLLHGNKKRYILSFKVS